MATVTTAQTDLRGPSGDVYGHPPALFILFFTEMWERFSYYGMRALLVLFLISSLADGGWAWEREDALQLYGLYTGLVYLTPIFGGLLADKVLGFRKAVILGALIMTIGHGSMALESPIFFYIGLGCLIVGNGLFKPNISSIVGQLYPDHKEKKDAAYTIFYMGINAGAFLGILLCGYIGEKIDWSYGFGLAGIFMLFGLLQFAFAQKIFGLIGLRPIMDPGEQKLFRSPFSFNGRIRRSEYLLSSALVGIAAGIVALAGEAENENLVIIATVLFLPLYWFAFAQGAKRCHDLGKSGWFQLIPFYGLWMAFQDSKAGDNEYGPNPKGVTTDFEFETPEEQAISSSIDPNAVNYAENRAFQKPMEQDEIHVPAHVSRDRIIVIGVFAFFTIFFWWAFEQAGGSMTVFAESYTDRTLAGGSATTFKIFNTVLTIAPMIILTVVLGNLFKRTFGKYALANIFLGTSFLIIWGIVIWMLVREFRADATEVPASWFGILNSFFIIAFAPLFSKMWESRFNPSGPVKFALGLILLGLGFAILAYGSMAIPQGAKVASVGMIWLILAYLFHTLGELCISPVGLSYVSKLAPIKLVGLMFGIWFIANFIANWTAGITGSYIDAITEKYSMSTFFLIFTFVPIAAGLIMLALNPMLKKKMHGID